MTTKTICTITLNPAFDQVGTTDKLTLGHVNKIQAKGRYPSGKGINVSRVLGSVGIPSSVTGFLGADNAREFEECFTRDSLENKFHYVAGSTRTNIKISTASGDVTDINFTGFTVTEQDWQKFTTETFSYLKSVDYVVIAGSLPVGVSVQAFADWLSSLKNAGVKLAVDTSGAALTAALEIKPWFAKPNNHELEEFLGKNLDDMDLLLTEGKKLQQSGIEHLIISLGEKGSIYYTPNGIYRATPPRIEHVVSTVGAGDSMVAGFMYGNYHDLTTEETLSFATALSAFAVMQENVGEKNPELLAQLEQQVTVTKIA